MVTFGRKYPRSAEELDLSVTRLENLLAETQQRIVQLLPNRTFKANFSPNSAASGIGGLCIRPTLIGYGLGRNWEGSKMIDPSSLDSVDYLLAV